MQRLLENIQGGGVLRASGGSFTFDDIREIGDEELRAIQRHFLRAAPKTGQRPDSMDGRHKIDLQSVIVAHDPEQAGSWVVRAHDHRFEVCGQCPQLAEVGRCLAEHEIQIDSADRCSLQSRCGIADEHGFEAMFLEHPGNSRQERVGVHSLPFYVAGPDSRCQGVLIGFGEHSTGPPGFGFAWPDRAQREVSASLRFGEELSVLLLFQPQNAPVNAVTQQRDIEVDRQARFPTTQAQTGKKLRVMNRRQAVES